MKKIIAVVIASTTLFFYGVTNSMAEWTAGISVSHGEYSADGEENRNGSITHANDLAAKEVTYPTIFFEKAFDYASVGISIIPAKQESEEASRTDYNCIERSTDCTGNDGTTGSVTNTAKVKLSQHVTLYTIVPIMDSGVFARAGIQSVNVKTKENLATGSTYPDTHMNGASLSVGYQHDIDGVFIRAEVGHTRYESITVKASNTANKIDADIDGGFARISIGRSF